MGFAMLMVVFHHIAIDINSSLFAFLHYHGGFGVDVFLLLSGLGLYFSTKKGLNLKEFYLKRIIRIIPIYAIVIAVVTLIKGPYNLNDYLVKVSTLGYWFNGPIFDWFIPALLFLYLIYPLFYYVLNKNSIVSLILVILIYFVVMVLPIGSDFGFLYRIPTFLIGIILGKLIVNRNEYPFKGMYLVIYSFFAIGVILLIYAFDMYYQKGLNPTIIPELKINGWLWLPYFLLTIGFSLFVAFVFKKMASKKLNNFFAFIGGISLEIYLIHSQFIELTRYITNEYHLSKPLIGFILISLSFIVAYYFSKLNVIIMNVLNKKLLNIKTI